ncbi:MAG: lactate utilization protein [Firmicutes bacterium]|nr:lactate utilization protein [Bacillota bacterium]
MTNAEVLRNQKIGPRVVEALKKRHFEAYYCDTAQEAKVKALSLIPEGDVVAWGGSVTLEQIGVIDELRSGKYNVIDRDTAQSGAERVQLMRQALLADTYMASSNAMTEDGQLVNIDGNGNRVAAMIYGPKNVILVIGMNKVVKTLEDAWQRARNLAAPTNVQRFGLETPCSVTGSCADCTSPDCICAYISTIRVSRPAGKIKIVLVGENLGF